MYEYKTTKIVDRREMLKIKIKSLAAETKIIKQQERKTHGPLREEMYRHRIDVVRKVTRDSLIAYGIIRGRTIEQMEPNRKSEPDWKAIDKMVATYGPKQPVALKAAA